MERIGVRELNQHTSRIIAQVKSGQVVEITDRGRLVARLVPIETGQTTLERLIAEGKVIPPTITGPIPVPPQLGDPGINAAAAITESRDQEPW